MSKSLMRENKLAWDAYEKADLAEVFALSDRYKVFMSEAKTERECVDVMVKEAKVQGFKDLKSVLANKEILKAGDKVYFNNMGKSLAMFVLGSDDIENGLRIIGSHVDAPRIDLKQNPLYEDNGLALLDTHYYGGIKKYQWVTLPLALHGVFIKKDGSKVNVVIGEDETDPVIGISDLLIHLSADQLDKKARNVIEGEGLNLLVGSMPLAGSDEKEKVKHNILNILNEKYDIDETDFISAELEVVPAGKARDYGLDRSMVMAYGHDDRICAYTSFEAILEVENPDKTIVGLFVDKEEIGSVGATGMHSKFFENALADIIDSMGNYSDLKVRRALQNSKMLSADVTVAYDPNFASVVEKNNIAYFGKGIVFSKYTGARGKSGCNDANAEYVAYLRNMMDENNVTWQTSELGKVDQGGGGTIAYILAQYNMEVIDCGVALHNMHAPWEVASKADIYEAKKCYKVFFEKA
ncbi:aminopeptidase [uncultured Clostridium sp.]|uniref:aminopeptidase n=1 Tax=uncultured Clostridium sp. TaxID=59620 RepID=UPI002636CE04|nr:aminopeptidase [uncultured Clostridium sp.]